MLKRFTMAALLLGTAAVYGQDAPRAIQITPARPFPAQPMTVHYDPSKTALAGKDSVQAIVYEYNHFSWKAIDLDLQRKGNGYEATFTPPADCGVVFFKFFKGDTADVEPGTGYVQMLFSDKAPVAAGAYAGYGMMRSPNYGHTVEGYLPGVSISDTATYYWMSQELSYHKDGRDQLIATYVVSNYRYQHDSTSGQVTKAMQYLLAGPQVPDVNYDRAIRIYRRMGLMHKADSLTAVEMQQYPDGYIARQQAFRQLASSNMDTTLARNLRFLQRFPPAKFEDPAAPAFGEVDYQKVYQAIIIIASVKKDYKPLYAYVQDCSYSALQNLMYKLVEIPYDDHKSMDAQTAMPLADTIMHCIFKYRDTADVRVGVFSPREWKEKHFGPEQVRTASLYARILMENGRHAEALEMVTLAQHYAAYSRAEINETYIRLLEANQQTAAMPAAIETAIRHNQATPWILEQAANAYVQQHGNKDGFEKYLDTLKGNTSTAAMMERLKGEIMNESLADFTMKDMNGKSVTLSKLKGKVVVLDFWASWCAPCKASFPGMNMARERWEQDEKVQFYFVDTQEAVADYKQKAKQYLADKHFPFQVLFDNGDVTKHAMSQVYDQYSKAFHLSGIPQKLIIGADGRLKFITVGYKGSPSELADEISAMVQLAKTTK